MNDEELRITTGGQLRVICVGELDSLNVKPGIFWVTLSLWFASDKSLTLDGTPK